MNPNFYNSNEPQFQWILHPKNLIFNESQFIWIQIQINPVWNESKFTRILIPMNPNSNEFQPQWIPTPLNPSTTDTPFFFQTPDDEEGKKRRPFIFLRSIYHLAPDVRKLDAWYIGQIPHGTGQFRGSWRA